MATVSRRRGERKAQKGARALPPAPVLPAPKPAEKPALPGPIRGALLALPKPDAEVSVFAEIADPKKRAYLEALATTPAVGEAARLAGISVRTGYNYRHDLTDTAFQAALPLAQALGIHRAEDEGWRRGIEGWEEPVYQGGRLVGTKRVKSDTMLIFMLKGALPEKYRERQEISGPKGGPIEVAPSLPAWMQKLTDEELDLLRGLAERAAKR